MADEDACKIIKLDYKKVKKLESDFRRVSKRAEKMGLTIFGGSGGGQLRYGMIILGDIGLNYDGGDGGTTYYEGIEIGEGHQSDVDNVEMFINKRLKEIEEENEEEEY